MQAGCHRFDPGYLHQVERINMYIACIACGGVLEVSLVMMGLGAIYRWFKRRHDKKNCDCCKEHEKPEDKPEMKG